MKKVALMKSNKYKKLRLVILMLYICWPHGELLRGTENKENMHNLEHWYSQWANIFI